MFIKFLCVYECCYFPILLHKQKSHVFFCHLPISNRVVVGTIRENFKHTNNDTILRLHIPNLLLKCCLPVSVSQLIITGIF